MALMMLYLTTAHLCSDLSGCSLVEADGTAHAFKGAELCSKSGINISSVRLHVWTSIEAFK